MSLSQETLNYLEASTGNLGAAKELITILNGTPNGNVTLGANNITSTTGNATIGGTLAVTGASTLTGAVTPTGGIVYGARTKRVGGKIRAGATAGWTFTATDTGSMANVAASQTNATAVVWLEGLNVGDVITGFNVYASINSAGNAVTLDANLRSLTIGAAATGTDASIASMTQVNVSAATASTSNKTGLSTTVVAGVVYYILLKATTGASTTIELAGVEAVVTPNPAQ